MAKLAEWADQLERRTRAAPEVIAVGPRLSTPVKLGQAAATLGSPTPSPIRRPRTP